jgi:hypothetical protein
VALENAKAEGLAKDERNADRHFAPFSKASKRRPIIPDSSPIALPKSVRIRHPLIIWAKYSAISPKTLRPWTTWRIGVIQRQPQFPPFPVRRFPLWTFPWMPIVKTANNQDCTE